MTVLYIQPHGAPAPIPFSAFDEDGRLWTDLASNEEGREATGWVDLAPEQPAYDPSTHRIVWDAEARDWSLELLPLPDMAELRTQALATAYAYGNAITAKITGEYADAEVLSWDAQEREARQLVAGETLPPEAILPGLAQDADRELADYAASVIENADKFRAIARAAVYIRRQANTVLMSEALDTPEKLEQAVATLRQEVDGIAAQVIGQG